MRVHEQIYTSAPRLLEGGGNLGVVAESRGFPRQLVPSLAPFRAYTILNQFSRSDPGVHPQRLVLGALADAKSFGITRTVFAGADHTGRTTPLAHHLVFEIAELRQSGHGIAELLSAVWPMLVTAWSDPPKWIEPQREVIWSKDLPKTSLQAGWVAFLAGVSDCMISFAQTGRAAVVVIDPNDAEDVPDHVILALSLLPRAVQWGVGVVTHVQSVSDYVRDAALIFTYPASPFLDQCRQRHDSRAPLILDLTVGGKCPPGALGPWGMMVAKDTSSDFQRTRNRCREFDQLGLSSNDIAAFVAAADLVDDLATAPREAAGTQWQALGEHFGPIGANPTLIKWVNESATTAIISLASDEQSATRWSTLVTVCADSRWPTIARRAAMRAILDGPEEAIDTFFGQTPKTFNSVAAICQEELAARPKLVRSMLSEAMTSADPIATSRAAHLLSAAALSPTDAKDAVASVLRSTAPVKQVLERPLLRALERALKNPADIVALWEGQPTTSKQQQYVGRTLVLPLLRKALDRTMEISWHELAERYRQISIGSGFGIDDLEWLLSHHGRTLSWAQVQAWIADARLSEVQRQQIRQVAQRAGMSEPAPSTQEGSLSAVAASGSSGIHPRRTAGVGPVGLGMYLMWLVVFTCLISWAFAPNHPVPIKSPLIAAPATVGLWIIIEILLRLFVRNPRQFPVARWARRALLLLLAAGFLAAAWPISRPMIDHLGWLHGSHGK